MHMQFQFLLFALELFSKTQMLAKSAFGVLKDIS